MRIFNANKAHLGWWTVSSSQKLLCDLFITAAEKIYLLPSDELIVNIMRLKKRE